MLSAGRPDSEPPVVSAWSPSAPRLTALLEVVLCSGVPTQLVLAAALSAVGISAVGRTGGLSLSYVVALSLGDSALLIALIVYFLRRNGEKPREVFLGGRAPGPEMILGLLLIPVTVTLAVTSLHLLHAAWPEIRNVPENPIEALIGSPLDAALLLVVAIIAGGVREELMRAFVLRRFEQQLGGGWLGLVIFSVVFGLGHYIQGWDAVLVTAILGALWGAIFLLRRTILSAMISHAGFNTAEVLIVVAAAASV